MQHEPGRSYGQLHPWPPPQVRPYRPDQAADETELLNAHAGETEKKQLAWLKDKRPELYREVNDAVAAKLKALQGDGGTSGPLL